MKKLMILGFMFLLFFACKKQEKCCEQSITSNPTLNKKEIVSIISAVKTNYNITEKSNYHLGYPKIFNDSTFMLEIAINNIIPSKDENVTNYSTHKENKVFIYNKSRLKIDLDTIKKEMLSSYKQGSPFFIPDSKSLSLMVQKRKGDLILSKIEPFLLKGTNNQDTIDTDF
jgi:hypothetical protein